MVRIDGESHYARALAIGRPVALIGLHAGLFELLHRIPRAPEERPFRILTAKAFSPPLTRFMAEGREKDGKKILWAGGDGDKGLERGLREVAAAKGVLALMADQHPGGSGESGYLRLWDSIAVPYPARLLRFLAVRGFTLLPVSTRLDGNGEVRFRFHPPWNDGLVPDPAGSDPGLEEQVRRFLEEAIAAAPEQWNWSYPKVVPTAP
jgi:lauroyl/myristoyl acyltransferase